VNFLVICGFVPFETLVLTDLSPLKISLFIHLKPTIPRRLSAIVGDIPFMPFRVKGYNKSCLMAAVVSHSKWHSVLEDGTRGLGKMGKIPVKGAENEKKT